MTRVNPLLRLAIGRLVRERSLLAIVLQDTHYRQLVERLARCLGVLGVFELLLDVGAEVLLEVLSTAGVIGHVLFDVVHLALEEHHLVVFFVFLIVSHDSFLAVEDQGLAHELRFLD